MPFLDILKRGANAAVSGVGSAMKAAIAPAAEAPAEAPAPEPQDRPSQPFSLPALDESDPDYAEKKAVHDALTSLDSQWATSMPDIDYQGHYRKISEHAKKAPKDREWNVLSKLAVALGTQNPDRPYDENPGLAAMRNTAREKGDAERKTFEEDMSLRKEALSGHIRQLMDQGNFRKALTELNAKEQMGVTRNRKEHDFRLAEIDAQGTVKKEVAKINAQAAWDRAEKRLTYLKEQGEKLKLSPSDKAMMDAEYRTAAAGLTESKKQWSEGMLSDEQAEIAEEEHRQEMRRIHDYWEDREIGDRPANAGPRKAVNKPAEGGMQPNPEDPWFKK